MLRVRWERGAVDVLTELWIHADPTTRKALTAASHAIDQRLRSNPQNEG